MNLNQSQINDARQLAASQPNVPAARGVGPRLFIGHVPKEITEDHVRSHFSQWGLVSDVYFPRHRKTMKRRPFCFVTFAAREVAERALQESPLQICGFPVKTITMVEDRETYYKEKHAAARQALLQALKVLGGPGSKSDGSQNPEAEQRIESLATLLALEGITNAEEVLQLAGLATHISGGNGNDGGSTSCAAATIASPTGVGGRISSSSSPQIRPSSFSTSRPEDTGDINQDQHHKMSRSSTGYASQQQQQHHGRGGVGVLAGNNSNNNSSAAVTGGVVDAAALSQLIQQRQQNIAAARAAMEAYEIAIQAANTAAAAAAGINPQYLHAALSGPVGGPGVYPTSSLQQQQQQQHLLLQQQGMPLSWHQAAATLPAPIVDGGDGSGGGGAMAGGDMTMMMAMIMAAGGGMTNTPSPLQQHRHFQQQQQFQSGAAMFDPLSTWAGTGTTAATSAITTLHSSSSSPSLGISSHLTTSEAPQQQQQVGEQQQEPEEKKFRLDMKKGNYGKTQHAEDDGGASSDKGEGSSVE